MAEKRVSVAHLTSAHPPGDVRIFLKECRTLAASGYDVTLVAQGDADSIKDSVQIRSVRKPHTRSERMIRTMFDVYRSAVKIDADIYHFHDPELIFAGVLLKLRGKKVIYDVHEDLPKQILTKYWIPSGIRRLVSGAVSTLESILPYAFDQFIVATPSIGKNFPARKTQVVQNFPMLEEFEDVAASNYASRSRTLAYVGAITDLRGAREMVECLSLLSDMPDIRLILAGGFSPEALQTELSTLPGWKSVDYRGQQSRAEVSQILAKSRIGLVLFHPAPNHVEAQPNKLFEYMSAGLPLIASDFPLWRELIEKEGVGLLVDPLDKRAIADAIRWLLDHPAEAEAMGKRGRELTMRQINWEVESSKLLETYARLSKSLV